MFLEELKKQFTSIHILITLLIISVGLYLFQTLWQLLASFSDIFIILIFAWIISFILDPLVTFGKRITSLSKVAVAVFVYLLFFSILTAITLLFIPHVSAQIQSLIKILPNYLASSPPFVSHWINTAFSSLDESLAYIPSVAQFFFSLFIILIISFYFVIDKERINHELFNLIPQKWNNDVRFIQKVIDTTFASFLRIQLIFGLMSGIATWIVLTLFHVDYAASTALLSGILTVIPLVGAIFAIIPPLIIPLITDPTKAFFIFAILLVLQQIEFNVIGPRLLGHALKLHPVIVLISFLAGYKIAGNIGALLAVPIFGSFTLVGHQLSHYFLRQPVPKTKKEKKEEK